MQQSSNYILNLSPKKLTIYLILAPLILFLIYTIATLGIRRFSEDLLTQQTINNIVLGMGLLSLAVFFILLLCWSWSTVTSVSKKDLGLPLRWFRIAIALFIIYLLYNLCFSYMKNVPMVYQDIFYPLNEFIAFGGLLIAYPTICHYIARAAIVKRNNKPSSFLNALPFTLVLFFGAMLAIPFLHTYFSTKSSTIAQILIIYAIAFSVFILLFIVGIVASIAGLV